jgi:hypothetical protein
MTVFQQVLWMLVNIRVLGKQPRLPAQGDDLIRYAAVLELQYGRICAQLGIARRRQMATISWRFIGLPNPYRPGCWSCSSVIEGSVRRSFNRLELAENLSTKEFQRSPTSVHRPQAAAIMQCNPIHPKEGSK